MKTVTKRYTTTTTTTPSTSTQTTASKYGSDKLKLMKDTFTVGTWNVRTLWATGKLELLRNEMKRYSYDVIGISEVRWTGKGETTNGDFIWCGNDNTHNKGVGMLLSTRARKALMSYNPINPRLITARFKATPFNITIINVYAPTSDATENDIEAFYSNLEDAIGKTPKKDILILTGDWNAKVGNDNTGWEAVMGRYGYGTRNERGEHLLEFATLHNLFICNTRFQQKPIRKWTWESPDDDHALQIEKAIKEALQASIPTQKATSKKPWISTQTLELADEKRKAKQVKHISIQLNNKYKHLCNEVKKAARKDKDKWIQTQCGEIQMGLKVGNSKQAYNLVKLLKKKFQPKLTAIRDQDGTIVQSKQGIMERWTKYCSGLYEDNGSGEKVVEELVNISPSNDNSSYGILYNEVQDAIQKLKKNKSPGTDEITAEMIQSGGEKLVHKIYELCNRAWEEETIPDEWGRSILVPIPKKGDATKLITYE
ncbi:unnamed protein product [Rotaria sp. Silwood2]|nr:unnamed protein product [Rotaria sp. Silwood2]CAF4254992.1 unnamed protein product [Rotaria sp. Silwood2]